MKQNPDLHGNAPDNSPVVLLLIDVINQDANENERVLKYMERVLEADIRPASEIELRITSEARSSGRAA